MKAKTIFTSELDSDGFIACHMYNDKCGFGAPLQAQFTAPLMYFDDIPLQIRYHRASVREDLIIVSCPLETTGFWFCTAIVKSGNRDATAILSPCTGSVSVRAEVYHVPMSQDMIPSCKFRIKLEGICRPFKRDMKNVFGFDNLRFLEPIEDVMIRVGTQEVPVNRKLLARQSPVFALLFGNLPDYSKESPVPVCQFGEEECFEDVCQFVKLATLQNDFFINELNVETLMRKCHEYEAEELMKQCIDFLFRTKIISRIDAVLIIEKYPQLDQYKYNMAKLMNAELEYQSAYMWPTDWRNISFDTHRLMEVGCKNVSVRIPPITLRDRDIKQLGRSLGSTHRIESLEGNRRYQWRVTITHQYVEDRMVTTVRSDHTSPWLVDLVVKLQIHEINHARPKKYEEHILATSESGYEKYNVSNRWALDRVKELKIEIDIKHAFLNQIAPTVHDFSRADDFTNLTVRIVNTRNLVTPVTRTFFVTKEILTQASMMMNSMLSEKWGQPNPLVMNDIPFDLFETFLQMAYHPNLIITNENFLQLLNATHFFLAPRMKYRLEQFYRSAKISTRIKDSADITFSTPFAKPTAPYFTINSCPTDKRLEEWAADFGETSTTPSSPSSTTS